MQYRLVLAGLASLAAVALLDGCGPPKVSDQAVQNLLYPQLTEMLADSKRAPVLVDVRTPRRFAAGHIPGAVNIPLKELRAAHPQLAGKGPIIVYSRGLSRATDIDDGLSLASAKKLIAAGYDADRVFDFRGGIDYWSKQGGQLTRD